jgi:hypothetical protein
LHARNPPGQVSVDGSVKSEHTPKASLTHGPTGPPAKHKLGEQMSGVVVAVDVAVVVGVVVTDVVSVVVGVDLGVVVPVVVVVVVGVVVTVVVAVEVAVVVCVVESQRMKFTGHAPVIEFANGRH